MYITKRSIEIQALFRRWRECRIDVGPCRACGGALRIIACIDDPEGIETILNRLKEKSACLDPHRFPDTRAPLRHGSPELRQGLSKVLQSNSRQRDG